MKLSKSGFKDRQTSVKLYAQQSWLISLITGAFLHIGCPPFLSLSVRAQLKSPPTTMWSSANGSRCCCSLLKKSTCWVWSFGAYMFTKRMRTWFKRISAMMYLPSLSAITFSILQSNFGFIKIITPLLFVEPWLKSAFPPHSASQVMALSLELYVSWRNEKW